MYELIYRSTSKRDITKVDISEILNVARDFNSQNEISGCLLFHNNEFIQILEGDKIKVETLYEKIKKDETHFNVLLITKGEKTDRIFKNWSMAYHELKNEDVENISKDLFIKNFILMSEITEKPTNAIRLFWYMSKLLLENNNSNL